MYIIHVSLSGSLYTYEYICMELVFHVMLTKLLYHVLLVGFKYGLNQIMSMILVLRSFICYFSVLRSFDSLFPVLRSFDLISGSEVFLLFNF